MTNLDLIPGSKEIQKDLWRDAILLDGKSGIQLGYIGNVHGTHHFLIEYQEGYRGFNYSDEEIEQKAKTVISILPESLEVTFGIVRHSK